MDLKMYIHSIRDYSIFGYLFITVSLLLCLNTFESSAQSNFPKTPSDAEGPFYPVIRQADEDSNLIQVSGRKNQARGDILVLSGKVVNTQGQPYKNALVEIWQTDTKGAYKDKRDSKPGERDPDFQYWGKAVCDEDGSYSFTTIVPGAYHPRPAHIHFKVWIDGNVRLTSQIYFRKTGSLLNTRSSQQTTPNQQSVDLQKIKDGEYKASFQIVI